MRKKKIDEAELPSDNSVHFDLAPPNKLVVEIGVIFFKPFECKTLAVVATESREDS